MIRPFTAVCMLLAAGSGLYLYQQKHRTQVLEKQILTTVNATIAAQRRILFLTAEWDLLNDPERLAKLADQFLKLKTMTPGQFASLDDLGSRLPAPRPANWQADRNAPDRSTEEPGEADPVAEAPLPLPPLPVPAPASGAAPVVAAPKPSAATPAVNTAARSAPASTPGGAGSATAGAPPSVATARPAAPQPAPVVASRPAPPVTTPVTVATQAAPAMPAVSALGMARGGTAPPAPVPVSAREALFPTGGN